MSIKVCLPEDLTISESTPTCAPGQIVEDGSTGKVYKYVYNAGAGATAAGDTCGFYATTPADGHISVTSATMLVSNDGTTDVAPCAGIALGAIAAGSYGWVQVRGYCTNITTDGGVAAGDPLVIDGAGTPGKVADTAVAGDAGHGIFGFALAADTSTTLAKAYIRCVY